MQPPHDLPNLPSPAMRFAGHLLGSLGLVLWTGGLLAAWSGDFLAWFPWEAATADRVSSVLGGASLMAVGRCMLVARRQDPTLFDDDGLG